MLISTASTPCGEMRNPVIAGTADAGRRAAARGGERLERVGGVAPLVQLDALIGERLRDLVLLEQRLAKRAIRFGAIGGVRGEQPMLIGLGAREERLQPPLVGDRERELG